MTSVLDEQRVRIDQTSTGEAPVSGGANLGYTQAQCSARTTVTSTFSRGFLQHRALRRLLIMASPPPLLLFEDKLRKNVFTCEMGRDFTIACLELEHFVLIFKAHSDYAMAGTSNGRTRTRAFLKFIYLNFH